VTVDREDPELAFGSSEVKNLRRKIGKSQGDGTGIKSRETIGIFTHSLKFTFLIISLS
jgi:hypothetical protein